MFNRLKNSGTATEIQSGMPTRQASLINWAAAQGIAYLAGKKADYFTLTGKAGGWPWQIELGPTSRQYIAGNELRARVKTRADDDAAVIVMNRALKDLLEEQAYSLYTNSLQTEVQPGLIEEMRWLAAYPEVGWENLPEAFWARYAVLADRRSNAMAWITDDFGQALVDWTQLDLQADAPFMMMLLRGKVHLRMQCDAWDLAQLAQIVELLNQATQAIHAVRSHDVDVDLDASSDAATDSF